MPLLVRHTKADLRLPEPVHLPTFDASLTRVEPSSAEGQRAFTARVTRHAATHVLGTVQRARDEYRAAQRAGAAGAREPKAVIFSEFENDLEQVPDACLPPRHASLRHSASPAAHVQRLLR